MPVYREEMKSRMHVAEVPYGGWKRTLKVTFSNMELVIPLEVGIRILRFGFVGGRNVFKEFKEQLGGSGESEWCIRGGHRLWTAPEDKHSYDRDNHPIRYRVLKNHTIELIQQPSTKFGFQKTIRIKFKSNGLIELTHILRNTGRKVLHVYPWALSVLDVGGTAYIPQPPRVPHPIDQPKGKKKNPKDLLPNRKVVLWQYTNFSDPRYKFEDDFWIVQQDKNRDSTKFGYLHKLGWVYYKNGDTIFAKHVDYKEDAIYPDDNSNFELFTNQGFLELESLAPARPLLPGRSVEHLEHWALFHSTNWSKASKLKPLH